VNGELRRIYADRIARGSKSATREADVIVLLELGAHAEAVEALEEFALADPKRWLSTYLEAATKAGQRQQTVWLLERLADTPTLSASLRSQLAFRLLEAGDKAAAERTFHALAPSTGPRDAATRRLLFVWGPRPTQPQLEWLEARALEASGQERAAWMRLLTERGAAARAMAVYRKTVWPSRGGDDVLEAHLEALAVSGDRGLLASTLQEMASRTSSGDMLARLAREAAAVGDAPLERRLLEAALSADNNEPALQRALGLLAYRTRDLRAAELHLTAFNERTGGDVDTYRALGELRLMRGDAAAAKASFEQALLALERRPDASFEGRMTKAGLLDRLRRPAEARRLYEELLAERPNDGNVRADYVAMLMDLGESRSAQALLEAR
jgi:tetratricopeptide (TPR) repeat protein